MEVEEQFVSYIVQTTLKERAPELAALGRDISRLEKVTPPFPRISYDDALDVVKQVRDRTDDPEQKKLLEMEWGTDFGSPHETAVAESFEKPVFVHHYPAVFKAFYMEPTPGRPETCESVDLLAPEGYGEIIGGGQRMSRVEDLENAIQKHKLRARRMPGTLTCANSAARRTRGSAWASSARCPGSAGWITSRETIPFPRMLNRIYP